MNKINLIGVIGPTATGKTSLAVQIANKLNSEVISADSRQVYRRMDLGTGKDLSDFTFNNKKIPYHLIDIHEPGYEYNLYEYQKDFYDIFQKLLSKNSTPILCGGSGLYVDSVLKGYELLNVPENIELRNELEDKDDETLKSILKEYKTNHNTTDFMYRKRLLRAIEIADYYKQKKIDTSTFPKVKPLLFGIKFEPPELRKRITTRLHERIEFGMIEEVENLLKEGVSSEKLEYYGLEYKFIVQYIQNKQIKYNDMFQRLNSAIHQFAKRQRTWYRRMEKQGTVINWIDGNLSLEEKISFVFTKIDKIKLDYKF